MKLLSLLVKFCAAMSIMLMFAAIPAKADPLKRGLQGAIGGAIIGGIVKGGKGAGKGAAIGGAIGIIGGALEAEERRQEREYINRQYRKGYYAPSGRYSAVVEGIQAALVRLGYRPGPIDGVYGRQTAWAIGVYQDEHGLAITRRPSVPLLNHMRRNGG